MSNYGARQISPLVKTCLDENGKLTSAKQCLIASTVFNINRRNWVKQYETMLLEYNPIENYNMVETHTGSDTKTDTPDDWKETSTQTPTDWKNTETQTPTDWKETETKTPTNWTETETQTPTDWVETTEGLKADNEANTENKTFAFNSASNDPVPVSQSQADTNAKTTVERTGTFETSKETSGTFETEVEKTGTYKTETEQSGTYKTETERTGSFESKTEYDTELTRSGNIGVTTSQQMIESERSLWVWNFFQNVVFKDVAKMLSLSIY